MLRHAQNSKDCTDSSVKAAQTVQCNGFYTDTHALQKHSLLWLQLCQQSPLYFTSYVKASQISSGLFLHSPVFHLCYLTRGWRSAIANKLEACSTGRWAREEKCPLWHDSGRSESPNKVHTHKPNTADSRQTGRRAGTDRRRVCIVSGSVCTSMWRKHNTGSITNNH